MPPKAKSKSKSKMTKQPIHSVPEDYELSDSDEPKYHNTNRRTKIDK